MLNLILIANCYCPGQKIRLRTVKSKSKALKLRKKGLYSHCKHALACRATNKGKMRFENLKHSINNQGNAIFPMGKGLSIKDWGKQIYFGNKKCNQLVNLHPYKDEAKMWNCEEIKLFQQKRFSTREKGLKIGMQYAIL